MSFAVRKDGLGWRAVDGPDDIFSDELYSEFQPAPIAADPVAEFKQQAQTALTDSDKTILRCYESGSSVPTEWADYRKSLRIIISSPSVDTSQSLPPRPEYPVGT